MKSLEDRPVWLNVTNQMSYHTKSYHTRAKVITLAANKGHTQSYEPSKNTPSLRETQGNVCKWVVIGFVEFLIESRSFSVVMQDKRNYIADCFSHSSENRLLIVNQNCRDLSISCRCHWLVIDYLLNTHSVKFCGATVSNSISFVILIDFRVFKILQPQMRYRVTRITVTKFAISSLEKVPTVLISCDINLFMISIGHLAVIGYGQYLIYS